MVTTGSSKAAYYYCGEAIPPPATAYCCPESATATTGAAGATPAQKRNLAQANILVHNHRLDLPPGVVYYDPYQVLHLRRDATTEEITLAYRRFAVLRHPSRHRPAEVEIASQRHTHCFQFAAVSAAYETLSVTETRQRMDVILNGRGHVAAHRQNDENDNDGDLKTVNGKVIKPRAGPDRTEQEIEFRKQLQKQRRQALRHKKEAKRLAKKKRRGIRGMVSTAVQNRKKSGKSRKNGNTDRSLNHTATNETNSSRRHAKKAFTAVIPPMHQRAPVSSVSESADGDDPLAETQSIGAGAGDDSSFSTAEEDDDVDDATISTRDESVRPTAIPDRKSSQPGLGDGRPPRNVYTTTSNPANPDASTTRACLPPCQIHAGCMPIEHGADKDDDSSDSEDDGEEATIVFSKSNGSVNVSRAGASSKEVERRWQRRSKCSTRRDSEKFPLSLPALVQSSTTCSTTKEDVQHYSTSATERLFGGPLLLMYQARRWQPFSDPHVVFERVFGSELIGNRKMACSADDHNGRSLVSTNTDPAAASTAAAALLVSASPSAWAGTTETLADGTVVNVKSRIIQNTLGHRRLMKRTVTRLPADPNSGLCHTTIAVTSEDLDGPDAAPGSNSSAKGKKAATTTPCPPEICVNEAATVDAHSTTKSMLSSKTPRGDSTSKKSKKLDDSGTAATADDDWSLASLCQSWLSPCCG